MPYSIYIAAAISTIGTVLSIPVFVDIHRTFGLFSLRGLFWIMVVMTPSPLGVLLYAKYRRDGTTAARPRP